MSILRKLFKATGLLIRNPWKLNLILNQNEEWQKSVLQKYHIESLNVLPLSHFMKEEVCIEPYSYLDGGSMPTDLALLKLLAGEIRDCSYFEIGTWRGESVAAVSDSARICYTLNLPDDELKAYNPDPDFLKSQRMYSGKLPNVRHISCNSATFDFKSPGMKFDLVFIDGDHHYQSVVNDSRNVLEYLIHDHSVIVWHDYAWNPEMIRYETFAAILDACPPELHRHLYHVENTNCAVLYRKDGLKSHPFKKYAVPDHSFSVKLKINPS